MSKNAAGQGNIRQRKNGSWEGRFTVGRDFATGKPIVKSVYGKTQAEVRKKMTQKQHEIDTHQYLDPEKQLLADWLHQWLTNYCEVGLAPLTLRNYRNNVDNHIIPILGQLRLEEITPDHVQYMIRVLSKGDPQKGKKPLSPKSVRNCVGCLSAAMEKAVTTGKVKANPAAFKRLSLPKLEKTNGAQRSLTTEQQTAFVEAAHGSRYYVPFMFCLILGLREGECLGLPWYNVHIDKDTGSGYIVIDQQLQNCDGYNVRETTKSGKSRTIRLPKPLVEMLMETKQNQLEARLKAGRYWSEKWTTEPKWQLVFTDELGENVKFRSFVKEYKRICRAAGIPEDSRVHDLRHTAATNALSDGVSVKAVQNLLGHSTATITLDIYSDFSKEMSDALVSSQESFFSNIERKNA